MLVLERRPQTLLLMVSPALFGEARLTTHVRTRFCNRLFILPAVLILERGSVTRSAGALRQR
jgi:hypothetical protein